MKKILIAGIIVLIVGVIVTAFFFSSAMTDPIPPQVRAGWYLPHQDIVWTNSGPDLIPSNQERLVLAGHRDASAPQFLTGSKPPDMKASLHRGIFLPLRS